MNREIILVKLDEILGTYISVSSIEYSRDIMDEPLFLSERETASFFLDVEREFAVDLNKLIPELIIYSINTITDKLLELCKENNASIV
jgi:hypothetical protein